MKSFTSTLRKICKTNKSFSLISKNSLFFNTKRNFSNEVVRLFSNNINHK